MIVLHYNNPAGLRNVCNDLRAQEYPSVSVIVADNSTSSECLREAAALADEAGYVHLPLLSNVGYGAAMNAAMNAAPASTSYYLLLTHDARIATDYVAVAAGYLDSNPLVAVVGPVLRWGSLDGEIFSAGGVLTCRGRTAHRQAVPQSAREAYATDWCDGAVLFARAKAMRGEGGFWAPYFLYFEEVDLQLRMRQKGWRIEVLPALRAAQSPGSLSPYLYARNRYLFLARNRIPGKFDLVMDLVIRSSYWIRSRKFSGPYWALRGVVDGIRWQVGPPPLASQAVDWSPPKSG